jgi:hypothetical protein
VRVGRHGLARATSRAAACIWLGARKIAQIADVAVSIPLGGLVYYALCRAMRVAELEAAWSALAAPLARRLGLLAETGWLQELSEYPCAKLP